MAQLDTQARRLDVLEARRLARQSGHVQRAQTMLLAAGVAAFVIVAVAVAMMATLL